MASPEVVSSRSRQRGSALLVALAVLVLGGMAALLGRLDQRQAQAQRQKITAAALAEAKAALIAWSMLRGDSNDSTSPRPGDLPCPDHGNAGIQSATCAAGSSSTPTLGRLPWKTLGIDDLRDADGERLWYALSSNFRRAGLKNAATNSDTLGTLLLYGPDGSTLLTPPGEELAAIIFAPGPPLAGQDRSAGSNLAANYLDWAYAGTARARNNANATGPFIAGPVLDGGGAVILNDRAMAISARELIAAAEKRALAEAQRALGAYFKLHGKYPNPAPNTCTLTISTIASPNTCDSDGNRCFGRLPENVFGSLAAVWFRQNGWGRTLIYAVNKNQAVSDGAPECSPLLQVDGQIKPYVLFGPGTARKGQSRPSSLLANYLETAANNDAWTPLASGQARFTSVLGLSNDQPGKTP